ncbi:hypothetical protein [Spiroplasma floricola]|uniref:Transmembrane protein n=1 Tax=Spiroplasma floricola 23-6 TaxID=1336749 RepID=A0A2K8SDR0_9MOLU|nr:hypothetical protein [Spiroplasma floricola]AUB31596.1 hypothetical protein SFLOR_v1c05440 [Spiroplasma floricola 23-6]
MLYSSVWTSSVITGYILMSFTTLALCFFFANHFKRLKKMKLIWPENKYLNKKMYNFFNLYIFVGFIPMFLVMSIFFAISLIFRNIQLLGIIFTFCYLAYTVQLFLYIILLNNKQSSIVAFEYENQLILFNEVIKLEDIVDISHNLKRTIIFITFKDEKQLEDIIKLNYNWRLFDFLKGLNLKINN